MIVENKIKVAFVINDLLLGGAQMVVHALASKLDRTKFEPTVFYINEYPPDRATVLKSFKVDKIETKTSIGYTNTIIHKIFANSIKQKQHCTRSCKNKRFYIIWYSSRDNVAYSLTNAREVY